MPIEITDWARLPITFGTPFWVWFNTRFGKPFMSIVARPKRLLLWAIPRLLQPRGISQCSFCPFFGCRYIENSTFILLIASFTSKPCTNTFTPCITAILILNLLLDFVCIPWSICTILVALDLRFCFTLPHSPSCGMEFICWFRLRLRIVVGRIISNPTNITTYITGTPKDKLIKSPSIYSFLRFFECNYGTSGTPFDKIFGTFRDKLKETGVYKGGSEEKVDEKSAAIHDAKASLLGLPDPGFATYIALNCGIWALLYLAVQDKSYDASPHYLAFLVSFGPLIIAQIMANLTERSKRSIFYPFHKDGWKTMSSHLIISALVCIGPVYLLVHMLLANPGQSFYFWLRNWRREMIKKTKKWVFLFQNKLPLVNCKKLKLLLAWTISCAIVSESRLVHI